MSQDNVGGPQKNGPCAATPNTALGDTAGTPTNMITVEQAGKTIPITVNVTIAHPGWFRVALVEGASSTQTITTLPDPKAQTGTNCTPAILANPVWSTTQPIIADGLPAGSVASTEQTAGTHTFQVTIPANATCTSARPCALQVVMVMTDHPADDCYYHHCADIFFGATGATPDAGGHPTGVDAATPPEEDASGPTGTGPTGTGPTGTGPTGTSGDAAVGATTPDAGGGTSTSPTSSTTTSPSPTTSSGSTTASPGSSSTSTPGDGGSASGANAESSGDSSSGGCALTLPGSGEGRWAAGVMAAFVALAATRRRRRPR